MSIEKGASIIVNDWLQAEREEVLHFITDENHKAEAVAFEEAAAQRGAITKVTVLKSDEIQNGDVLEEMRNTMSYADAIIGATDYSFVTTNAVEYALKRGTRFLSIPMHTNDGRSLFEYDFIQMDPKIAEKMSRPLIKKLNRASGIRVTTELGTDITFGKSGRNAGLFNGVTAKKRSFGSASFEVYVPIEETKTNGKIILDGSLGYIGTVKEPVELCFENGYLVKIEDNADGKRLAEYLKSFNDSEMYCAAEFGIGLNLKSLCRGFSYIEDESVFGTFHVGMGRNLALGGSHEAEGHFDIVTHAPDIWSDNVKIMTKGLIDK
ncbi:MAG: peptidase [Oscillospiraceae bacterium]